MPALDTAAITQFLHDQVDAWNDGNRDAFFALYRDISGGALDIEYVGRAPASMGWPILDRMWSDQNPKVRIEVMASLVNGAEAACFHHNITRDGAQIIPTIEQYHFRSDGLSVRYFIGAPRKI